MDPYHKIQTLFKRHTEGTKKGKMIRGAWTTPELEYLADNEWEFTEKVDGTNIRIILSLLDDSLIIIFLGRTNNAQIPPMLQRALDELFPNKPVDTAQRQREQQIVMWMRKNNLTHVTLFGEGYGPKIQGGGKYREDHSFVLFDVKIGNLFLDRKNVNDVAESLGIDSVPVIGYGTLQDAIDIVSTGITFDKSGAVKRWGRGALQSQWGEFTAEGIVARPKVPMFDRSGQRIITKIKVVDFK